MNKEQYKLKQAAAKENYERVVRGIDIVYAKANNEVEVGDIVESTQSIVLVEGMTYTFDFDGYPCMLYKGEQLTKKMVPYKVGRKGTVYQRDMINHIKKGDSNDC